MPKKKKSPGLRPSNWERVDSARGDGNVEGMEYAMYLLLFVLHDSYDMTMQQIYPVIWEVQKGIELIGYADEAFAKSMVPAVEQKLMNMGIPLPYETTTLSGNLLFDIPQKGLTAADERHYRMIGRKIGKAVVRALGLNALYTLGIFSPLGLKEVYAAYEHWDEMFQEGYVTEREFRQTCYDEYGFMFRSYKQAAPEHYDETGAEADYHRFINKQIEKEKGESQKC